MQIVFTLHLSILLFFSEIDLKFFKKFKKKLQKHGTRCRVKQYYYFFTLLLLTKSMIVFMSHDDKNVKPRKVKCLYKGMVG